LAIWSTSRPDSGDGPMNFKRAPSNPRTITIRIRRAAEARQMTLPDPDEFVELMARVRKRKK